MPQCSFAFILLRVMVVPSGETAMHFIVFPFVSVEASLKRKNLLL